MDFNMKKMNFRKALRFCWGCMLIAATGMAPQTEAQTVSPVLSQTTLLAPYSYKLQDWSRLPDERLQLRLRLLDTRVEASTLYLKMEMEANGIKIENPMPLANGIPLAGGEEITLNASRLSMYFLPANLSLSGTRAGEVRASDGMLPDGIYTLKFKVYEATTGNLVSVQEMPAMFTLVSGEPPLLTSPAENETLWFSDPCHIRFQWMARHLQYAGGFSTEYDFEIAEIPEGVSAWKEYFNTLPLVYRQTTTQTFLDYDASMPILLPQKDYALRVRARCSNASGVAFYIKNNGYSVVQKFSYKELCNGISGLRIDRISATSAHLTWNEPIEARTCQVYYRKNGKPDAKWFKAGNELQGGVRELTLKDLDPSTGYECKVSVKCAYTESENDVIFRFTTLSKDNAHLECGNHNLQSDTSRSMEPLKELSVFDQIRTANGFVIDVEEVEGSDGRFSGKGNTHIPLLANTGVKVTFKNIFVNKNYELVSGTVKAERTITKL